MKTVSYLTNIHPRVINCLSTKQKLFDTLNLTIITPDAAILFNASLQVHIDATEEIGDEAMIHCPPFKIFQTTIEVTNGKTQFTTKVVEIKW